MSALSYLQIIPKEWSILSDSKRSEYESFILKCENYTRERSLNTGKRKGVVYSEKFNADEYEKRTKRLYRNFEK